MPPSQGPQIIKQKPTEWEQTLVAEEAPTKKKPSKGEAPEEALEAAPELEAPEPLEELEPLPDEEGTLEPLEEPADLEAPGEAPPVDVPADLEKYVRFDGANVVIKQPFLDREKKTELEKRLGGAKAKLAERRWYPGHRKPVHEIERAVDHLAWTPRYEPKAVAWLKRRRADRSTALKGLQRIPANILEKRVIFETEGGYVVEVVHRELGQRRRSHFVVPAKGGSKAALQAIRSGRFAQATLISSELVDVVATGPPGRGRGVAPGKIATWPIRNRHPVDNLVGMTGRVKKALDGIGIQTTDQLRVRSPDLLARHVPVGVDACRRWRWASEFLLLSNMDAKHADVLAAAGVEGLDHLQRLAPETVAARVKDYLAGVRGRKPVPGVGAARAKRWVQAARRMKKTKQAFPG